MQTVAECRALNRVKETELPIPQPTALTLEVFMGGEGTIKTGTLSSETMSFSGFQS